jgi:hypothetical protein
MLAGGAVLLNLRILIRGLGIHPAVRTMPDQFRGQYGDLSAALHAQLGQDTGNVILHGLFGQKHPLTDLPVGQTLPDQVQHGAFLFGQARQRPRILSIGANFSHQRRRGPSVQKGPPSPDRANRGYQFHALDVLDDIPAGARKNGIHHRLFVCVGRQVQAVQLR